jgi:excisionase family DNA binding protein
MEKNHETELVTEKQIAQDLTVSVRTARRLRMQKILPFYRIGRTIRYSRAECRKALQEFRVSTTAEYQGGNK